MVDLIWFEVVAYVALSEIANTVGVGPMNDMGYQVVQDTIRSIMFKSGCRAVNA